jgi:hypothetical protein
MSLLFSEESINEQNDLIVTDDMETLISELDKAVGKADSAEAKWQSDLDNELIASNTKDAIDGLHALVSSTEELDEVAFAAITTSLDSVNKIVGRQDPILGGETESLTRDDLVKSAEGFLSDLGGKIAGTTRSIMRSMGAMITRKNSAMKKLAKIAAKIQKKMGTLPENAEPNDTVKVSQNWYAGPEQVVDFLNVYNGALEVVAAQQAELRAYAPNGGDENATVESANFFREKVLDFSKVKGIGVDDSGETVGIVMPKAKGAGMAIITSKTKYKVFSQEGIDELNEELFKELDGVVVPGSVGKSIVPATATEAGGAAAAAGLKAKIVSGAKIAAGSLLYASSVILSKLGILARIASPKAAAYAIVGGAIGIVAVGAGVLYGLYKGGKWLINRKELPTMSTSQINASLNAIIDMSTKTIDFRGVAAGFKKIENAARSAKGNDAELKTLYKLVIRNSKSLYKFHAAIVSNSVNAAMAAKAYIVKSAKQLRKGFVASAEEVTPEMEEFGKELDILDAYFTELNADEEDEPVAA